MKALVLFLFCLLMSLQAAFSQAPAMFHYQAVLRDAAGEVISSEEVTVSITILSGGAEGEEVFQEEHHTSTSELGLVNLVVGSVESLGEVEWSDGDYYLGITVDGDFMGASRLVSVPFAMHAHQSADTFSGDYEDLENLPDLDMYIAVEDPYPGDMMYFDGNDWVRIPLGQEGQVLQVVHGAPQWTDPGAEPGTVTDIDGNVYNTILVDGVEWMAENLRTTRYADGTHIPSGLTASEWSNTSAGAFAVFDPDNVDDIDTQGEMVQLYGKLYNWYAVDDERGLCPEGWHVPSVDEWDALTAYVIDAFDDVHVHNVGNALKSCRQINSPQGGDCDTEEHPRWAEHDTEYGTDLVQFDAIPAGSRNFLGNYFNLGNMAFFWTSSEYPPQENISYRRIVRNDGAVQELSTSENAGFSVRCVRTGDE